VQVDQKCTPWRQTGWNDPGTEGGKLSKEPRNRGWKDKSTGQLEIPINTCIRSKIKRGEADLHEITVTQ